MPDFQRRHQNDSLFNNSVTYSEDCACCPADQSIIFNKRNIANVMREHHLNYKKYIKKSLKLLLKFRKYKISQMFDPSFR